MRRMRRTGPIRLIGPISPIGLIGLIGLIGCSSDPATDTLVPEPVPAEEKVTDTPIAFAAQQQQEQGITRPGNEDYLLQGLWLQEHDLR